MRIRYARLLEQDMALLTRDQLGQLLVAFQTPVQGVRAAINTLILSIGRDLFSITALVAVLIIQDLWMSATSLLIGEPLVGRTRSRGAAEPSPTRASAARATVACLPGPR